MSTMTNEVPQVIKVITALDGAQLEYEVFGNGEPLVILHGVFAGSWRLLLSQGPVRMVSIEAPQHP